ncbi:MAG: hypothetical protein QGG01_04870, partial [Roseibacillus sp.]|nr:hypothetical protein [Roseibacillus sp.]
MAASLTTVTRALAALTAATLPVLAQGEAIVVSSANHPALQRALAETPESDKDTNGQLSLEEYGELLAHQRPHTPEQPKAPLLPVRPNGDLVIHDFENNDLGQNPKWSPVHPTPLKDN